MNVLQRAIEALEKAAAELLHEETGMGRECFGGCPRCAVGAARAELRGLDFVEGHAESESLDGSHCGWTWREGPPSHQYQRAALLVLPPEEAP